VAPDGSPHPSHHPSPITDFSHGAAAVDAEACSAGGRARYFFYPTLRPLNDLRNMIFMRDIPVPATNGSVAGNMANDGPMRVATARSFILYDSNTSE
jgi:hypothetical protein